MEKEELQRGVINQSTKNKKKCRVTFNKDVTIYSFPNIKEERYNALYYDMMRFRDRIVILNKLLTPIFNKKE